MTDKKVYEVYEELHDTFNGITLWLEHDVHCDYHTCDICTCGLTKIRRRMWEAIERCRNLEIS